MPNPAATSRPRRRALEAILNSGVAAWAGALVISAALTVPAMAQTTAPEQDPRRARAGAKVTGEMNPEERSGPSGDEERVHEAFQPKGIELGEFLLLPKIEFDETYNSNLHAVESGGRSDFVTTIRPEVKLRSRFKEHAINLSALAEQYVHRRFTKDNRLDLQLDVDGRYDFTSETQANYFGQVFSRHEERGSPDDARGLEPTPTQGFVNRGSIKHQFGRFTVVGEGGLDRRTYGNVMTALGSTVRNDDRDRWEMLVRGRGSYEMFPGYAAVTELTANRRLYDSSLDRNGYDRSSHGYRVESGIGLDLSKLIRGDFLVGYLAQDYRDPRFHDPKGLSLRATFNWTPTTLTIVVPSLERSVNETTISRSSSMVRNALSLTVRHELERNIVLSGYTAVFYDEFQGVDDQNAWTYEARGRITYAFTPEFFVGSEIGHRQKRSQAVGASFKQSIVTLRAGLQL
ncbi:outer membrane beta-barrel protein [Azospirillum sp. TSO22-1]|uniref:outer membrane beta-barrel protein n=1 Tax=Azospirillum sp. TSO22-1 TaxID=716789 RepID=UPI000D656F44|nr:outer membrane beta-barrel protein [Azospirillum sp. TSO22-1]